MRWSLRASRGASKASQAMGKAQGGAKAGFKTVKTVARPAHALGRIQGILEGASRTAGATTRKTARGARRRIQGRPRRGRIIAAGVGGAIAAFFLDPQAGKRRRNVAADRLAGLTRRGARKAERAGRYAGETVSGKATGVRQEAKKAMEPEPELDDVTLARKVETVIFRPADAPKGDVNVNAEDGVVYLRGQIKQPEQIRELVGNAEKVSGVREVVSLLHLPGDEAKAKDETSTKKRQAKRPATASR